MTRCLNPDNSWQKLIDMTTFAAGSQVLVYRSPKRCGGESTGIQRRIMTDTAFTLGRNMINRFSGCDAGIMAHGAVVRVYVEMVINNAGKAVEIGDAVAV